VIVESKPPRPSHPVTFLILFLPFGALFGYVSVALAYGLTRAGVSVGEVAALVALGLFPHTWKVLWAPVVDTTFTNKRWYLASAVTTGLCLLATAAVPLRANELPLLAVLVLMFNITGTFMGMSAESLMAHTTPRSQKGRAAGWSQAGNVGGAGLGGGAALWLTEHYASWTAGAALGLTCIACCAALLFLSEPPPNHRAPRLIPSLVNVGRDVWRVARSRLGFLALVLLFLPTGSGAASNLWAAIASGWHATADTVALVNGVLGGVISMVGCLIGGRLCDLMDRKMAYCAFGVALGLCALFMAIAPRTPSMFVVFTCVYAFINGFIYAGFSSVVLEAIGAGAAATKYNLFASLANMPTAYMTVIEGWTQTRWGSGTMLVIEAVLGVAGVLLFLVIAAAVRTRDVLAS
jgi:MFS transporter, PAT family, beta-lactamase induction signal transducer AmpG